jgi:hypothetical protein
VVLRQLQAEDPVLHPREQPVAQPLPARHPARHGAVAQEPRPDHHVGLAREDRLDHLRDERRVVLVVPVDHDHHVGPVEQRAGVAGLLRAAVAAVGRVAQDVEAVGERHLRRVVRAEVVDEQRGVRAARGKLPGDRGQRPGGPVGRQHHVDARGAAAGAHERLGRAAHRRAVGEDDVLVAEREAHGQALGHAAGQRAQRRLERADALGQALDPAAGGERAHERHVGRDDQAARGEQLAQRPAGQQAGVRGQVPPPAHAGQARRQRGRVGRHDAEHAVGAQERRAVVDPGQRVVEVLEDVDEQDDVEPPLGVEVLERRLAHVEPRRSRAWRAAERDSSRPTVS